MTEATKRSRERQTEVVGDAETDDLLVAKYIVRDPNGLGADEAATIWGVPVWAIVGYLRGEGATLVDVAEAYDLPHVAVRAALAYYRQHPALIDARLLLNESAFE